MDVLSPVTEVKGVGLEVAKKLAVLGIRTVGDLIHTYPRRYDDYSHIETIGHIRPGTVTIRATIKQVTGRYVRRGLHVTEAVASDESGSVRLVWFNQPYRAQSIKSDTDYFISGEFAYKSGRLAITSPSMELVSDFTVNTARIIPIYRETKGFKSTQLRKFIREVTPVISKLSETLPDWIVQELELMSRADAIMNMHFPASDELLQAARRRLGFEEVFELSLAGLLNKYELMQDTAIAIAFDEKMAREFVARLPFQLTDGQRKVIWQIYQDIQKTSPMNRLIEGDVGSGKDSGGGHGGDYGYEAGVPGGVYGADGDFGAASIPDAMRLYAATGIRAEVGLLIGGLTPKQKAEMHKRAADHAVSLLVGTHALITDKVDMYQLGLIVIDEQHRFGVDQRKALLAKAGHAPHVLNMTATPIPRSLALSLYGGLDISILDTKPIGRKPIITKLTSPNSRAALYKQIEPELAAGRQMFVVCP